MHQKVEQFLERLLCSSRFRLHEFADNRYMKIANPSHRPPLPPGNAPGTHFCLRLSRPQGHSAIGRILCQWKISMTPAVIEPATFQFVAQHLNHCATAVPLQKLRTKHKHWRQYDHNLCISTYRSKNNNEAVRSTSLCWNNLCNSRSISAIN